MKPKEAWATIEDPHAPAMNLTDLGEWIAERIDRVAGVALDVTSRSAGEYGRILNLREFSSPGTIADSKSRSALNWIGSMSTDYDGDLVAALGPKVQSLMELGANAALSAIETGRSTRHVGSKLGASEIYIQAGGPHWNLGTDFNPAVHSVGNRQVRAGGLIVDGA